jgi:exodeoxyribonuclease VII large subunit
MPPLNPPLSISQLVSECRLILEKKLFDVTVEGEISNLAMPRSGHWYFTLKDSKSQIRCAMFKGDIRKSRLNIQNGDQIQAQGRISVYEPRGDLQFIASRLMPAGAGQLQQAYEALKAKLAAEGLFDPERKRQLPDIPAKIGIITSPSGAAIKDVLTVLARRWPLAEVVIYPSEVQGQKATSSLISALHLANRRNEVDVLLLTRGGGSLEDLWCFNDEKLVRAVANSPLICVSAVGHEIDTTLCDLAADHRSPTPSAAAEQLVPDQQDYLLQLKQLKQRLEQAQQRTQLQRIQALDHLSLRLEARSPQRRIAQANSQLQIFNNKIAHLIDKHCRNSHHRLNHAVNKLQANTPAARLNTLKQHLIQADTLLQHYINRKLALAQHQLAQQTHSLDALSPLNTLKRGYSVTQNTKGQVIKQKAQVSDGEKLTITLSDGKITTKAILNE